MRHVRRSRKAAPHRVETYLFEADLFMENGDYEGAEGAADLMTPVETEMQRGYDTFAGLVDRFYNTKFVDNMLFNAPEEGRFRAGVISVLAGDVYRDDNPFQDMLLRSRRSDRASETVSAE